MAKRQKSRRPAQRTAAQTLNEIHGILFPSRKPDAQWSPDTIDLIATIVRAWKAGLR